MYRLSPAHSQFICTTEPNTLPTNNLYADGNDQKMCTFTSFNTIHSLNMTTSSHCATRMYSAAVKCIFHYLCRTRERTFSLVRVFLCFSSRNDHFNINYWQCFLSAARYCPIYCCEVWLSKCDNSPIFQFNFRKGVENFI